MKLIKDEKYLLEDYKVQDLFNLSVEQKIMEDYIQHSRDKSLIAFVGDYGIGKSTILYQIEKKQDKERWLYFDAWKYPERQSLWEGFVLDMAEQIGTHKATLRQLDGKASKPAAITKGFIGSLFATAGKIPIAPILKPLTDEIIKAYEPAPVKRVFEIQAILRELINSQSLPLRIVVEDVDRSGDNGVYFLETLSHFVKNEELTQEVKIIVPMATDKYNDPDNRDSYLKSIDYVTFYRPIVRNIDKLLSEIFSTDLIKPENLPNITIGNRPVTSEALRAQLREFIMVVFALGVKPRQFKSLLREWKLAFDRHAANGHNPDWRLELLVQAGKYAQHSNGTYYDNMISQNSIPSDSLFGSFLFMIYSASMYIKEINSDEYIRPTLPIKFVSKAIEGVDVYYDRTRENQFYAISDWYLK